MAPAGGLFVPLALRSLRRALKTATQVLGQRLEGLARSQQRDLKLVSARARVGHSIDPRLRLRQKFGRWYSTQRAVNATFRRCARTFVKSAGTDIRLSLPSSHVASVLTRCNGISSFASTLRPNLTGGAFPRTAGGYNLGGGGFGGARYFSHTPAAPAQVVQNVSVACRAFWLSGQKAQFHGTSPRGDKCYRAVSVFQDKTKHNLQSHTTDAPGSSINFHISPLITALNRLDAVRSDKQKTNNPGAMTLNTEGFLEVLSVDFSRALKDLVAVLADLKRLANLGDLPIYLVEDNVLRVRFPGCDMEFVERLCNEAGIRQGIVCEDDDFLAQVGGEMALRFPLASTSDRAFSSRGESLSSQITLDREQQHEIFDDTSGDYRALEASNDPFLRHENHTCDSSGFEGVEGIYRFLEECDRARRLQD